jgi:hypothetical protein
MLISEPFEFGVGPLEATVVTSGVAANAPGVLSVLLHLRSPIHLRGNSCEYLVARPRMASKDLSEVATNASVESSIVGIPTERVTTSDPLNLSWWRGGIALRGTISRRWPPAVPLEER